MRKRLLMTAMVMMVLFIGVGGCTSDKPSYVTVIVDATVCVRATDYAGFIAPIKAALVQITIEKDSGENVQYDEITDAGGCATSVRGTFNVYEKQFVRVTAKLGNASMPAEMGGGSLDPSKHQVSNTVIRLDWNTIKGTGMGGTRYWYPFLEVIISPKRN